MSVQANRDDLASLATDKTEAWIARRTGHRSSQIINTYRRAAACHEELHTPPLDSLVQAIPELAGDRAHDAQRRRGHRVGRRGPHRAVSAGRLDRGAIGLVP